jgi:hypothetical protein
MDIAMAFSFRRSLKIAPGVRLNIGKTGGSVRLGPRGMGYTFGTSGQRVTAGIPGTGLSATRKIGAKGRRRLPDTQEAHLLDANAEEVPGRSRVRLFFWVAFVLIVLWLAVRQ